MNYRAPYVVTPEGRLIPPNHCWVVWLTGGEINNWRSAVERSHRYLGETVKLFGGQDLKVGNFAVDPKPVEALRDESATARPNVLYDMYLEGISELELHVLLQMLGDRWATGNFADGRDGEAGQACAKLLERLTDWVKDVSRQPEGEKS